jgi:hypothetical protein
LSVLDLSSYDIPTLNATCFKENGVTDVILGVYSPVGAPEQMGHVANLCRNAGLNIKGFYGFVYFGSAYGQLRDIIWAIQLAKRFGVDEVWIDAEIDGAAVGFTDVGPVTPLRRVNELLEAVALVEEAGLKPGIYTGGWWWPSQTNNSARFSHLPLWHAAYADNLGTYSEVRTVNYGGWTNVAIHQWTSTRRICNRERDHNTIWTIEEDESMSAQDVARIDRLERIIATNQIGDGYSLEVVCDPDNGNALQQCGIVTPVVGTEYKLAGDFALRYLDLMGTNIIAGLGAAQASFEHTHDTPAGQTGGVNL